MTELTPAAPQLRPTQSTAPLATPTATQTLANRLQPFYSASKSALDKFIRHGMDVSSRAPTGFPLFNYFAFNFRDDEIYNFKLYFTFYHDLERSDIVQFLPTMDDFDRYYHLWKPFRFRDHNNSGCSFAIKVPLKGEPTYQFHFRFPYVQSVVSSPERFKLSSADLDLYQGISYEYTGSETVVKKYYYLPPTSPSALKVLRDFKEPNLGQILEYTEMGETSKVIHWFRSRQQFYRYLQIGRGAGLPALAETSQYRSVIAEAEQSGLTGMFPGVYENGRVRSIYFLNSVTENRLLFETMDNHIIDTVGPHILPLMGSKNE